jgi:hypothetical protein
MIIIICKNLATVKSHTFPAKNLGEVLEHIYDVFSER